MVGTSEMRRWPTYRCHPISRLDFYEDCKANSRKQYRYQYEANEELRRHTHRTRISRSELGIAERCSRKDGSGENA